jgi:hypothetical protein
MCKCVQEAKENSPADICISISRTITESQDKNKEARD